MVWYGSGGHLGHYIMRGAGYGIGWRLVRSVGLPVVVGVAIVAGLWWLFMAGTRGHR